MADRAVRLIATLALAQLRHLALRWSLLVVGVALVVLIPVVTSGLALSVQARTIRQTVGALDARDRTLLVSQEADSTLRRGTVPGNDAEVRRGLATLTSHPVVRELRYRPITAGGATFLLGGTDDLPRDVRLTGGRLPTSCTPTRCEVVALGASTDAITAGARSIGVVVVGTARRVSPVLASGQLDPRGTPLLLAGSAEQAAQVKALELFGRYYSWTSLVDADQVVRLGVGGWLGRAERLDSRLASTVGGTSLTVPSDPLQEASGRAAASGHRLNLLGGFAAVLLFGFAVVAAAGLRRDHELLALTLRRRGATPVQRWGVTGISVVVACLLAAALGAIVGAVVVAVHWSAGVGLGPASAAGHALAASGPFAAALTAVAGVVVAAVLLWPDTRPRDVWRVLDVIAVAAVGAAVLAGDRGATSAGDLASDTDPLVIALPVLGAVVAGIVAARLWLPAIGVADRLAGYRVLALRLALVGAVRRPLRPTATAAFVAAAVAAVIFTGTYRATLLANDADQAAYRVPLGTTLAGTVAHPAPTLPGSVEGSGVRGFDVVRTAASVPTTPGAATSATLLAPDASALPLMSRWSRTTGSARSARQLADALRLSVPAGPTFPAGTRSVSSTVTGFDPNTALTLWVRGADGTSATVDLTVSGERVSGVLPDLGAGPITVRAFGIGETFNHASRRAHGLGEGSTDRSDLTGRITVAPFVPAGGTPVSWLGWGSRAGGVTAAADLLTLTYRIGSDEIVCVPRFAAVDSLVLPVAADPATATTATGGALNLQLDASTTLRVRVVASLPRMPTVSGPFALADLPSLLAVLDLTEPGRAADEIWVHGASAGLDRFLDGTPLAVTRAAAVADALDRDPIGEGTRTLLVIVAALALAGAAVALMLLVIGERRDGAGELYSWEADGVAPRALRRMLALRALLVAGVGVPVGVAAGLILAVAGAKLVAVDATGSSPTPPIEIAFGGVPTVLVLVLGLGAGLGAGALVALAALRERLPRSVEAELR